MLPVPISGLHAKRERIETRTVSESRRVGESAAAVFVVDPAAKHRKRESGCARGALRHALDIDAITAVPRKGTIRPRRGAVVLERVELHRFVANGANTHLVETAQVKERSTSE